MVLCRCDVRVCVCEGAPKRFDLGCRLQSHVSNRLCASDASHISNQTTRPKSDIKCAYIPIERVQFGTQLSTTQSSLVHFIWNLVIAMLSNAMHLSTITRTLSSYNFACIKFRRNCNWQFASANKRTAKQLDALLVQFPPARYGMPFAVYEMALPENDKLTIYVSFYACMTSECMGMGESVGKNQRPPPFTDWLSEHVRCEQLSVEIPKRRLLKYGQANT